jgi:hypothetical protein
MIRFGTTARKLLVLFSGVGFSGVLFHTRITAQAPNPDGTGMECIDEMEIPPADGLLWVSATTGVAKVSLTIRNDGSPSRIEVESREKLLVSWVKRYLRRSSFRRVCKGRTLQMTFVYKHTDIVSASPNPRIKFKFPNTFELTANKPGAIGPETVN